MEKLKASEVKIGDHIVFANKKTLFKVVPDTGYGSWKYRNKAIAIEAVKSHIPNLVGRSISRVSFNRWVFRVPATFSI